MSLAAGNIQLSRILNGWLMPRLGRALDMIGQATTAKIKDELRNPCPVFFGQGGEHSPPGEPPFKETGALQEGIRYYVSPDHSVTIMSTRQHGADTARVPEYLEYGTPRMAARPFMRPAKNRGFRIVPQILRLELGR